MKLREELALLIHALVQDRIPYALCGGLAMAAHGWPRSTMDVDMLIEPEYLEKARHVARSLGYTHEPGEVRFGQGGIILHRMVKISGGDAIPLDLLLVTDAMKSAWESRQTVETEDGILCVVSPEGLIAMKSIRKSGTDLDDIQKLKGHQDHAH